MGNDEDNMMRRKRSRLVSRVALEGMEARKCAREREWNRIRCWDISLDEGEKGKRFKE